MTQQAYDFKITPAEIEQREELFDKHSAWVHDGTVLLANNEDPHYTEVFETREEVERFVAYLRAKADEAWPNH